MKQRRRGRVLRPGVSRGREPQLCAAAAELLLDAGLSGHGAPLPWSSSPHWGQQEDKAVGITLGDAALRRKWPSEAMGALSEMPFLCFVALGCTTELHSQTLEKII